MAQKPFVLPSGVDFYAGDGTAAGAADPLLVVSDSTNKVGINSQTPTGTLDITTASSSDRGLIVRGLASQSSSIVEAQDSGGNTLSYFGPSGVIGGSGINVNQYHTSASGSPRFRVPIGNNNWAEYPNFPKISTYGSIVAQGVQLLNDSTLQVTVSGYTTGSLTGVYYYRITAVGPNGDENPYSPGYATTPITSIPPGTPSGVVLTWTNPTTNYIPVAKWRIYRGTANQAYGAGTMGTANPFTTTNSPSSYKATAVGTSVYFDTADGNVSSFTDSGSAGTVGFPPDHFRGAEGWLAANRGLYTPELFTCIAQGGYSIARAVNVNGVIFTNAAIDGGSSNAKTMQMPSLAIQMTDSAGIFQISNTTLTNASLQVSVSATNGGYLIVNDNYGMKSRLGPHITNTLSDSSSASGIAYYFNTSSALTDPRKLMSVQNSATERFAISAYGTTTHTLSNSTAKGVVITAAASQTANLLEIQNSSSVISTWIDPSGRIGQNIGNSTISNIAIGSGVAPSLTVGSGNIIIGDEAGKNLNGSSSYNVIINQGSSDPQQTAYSPTSSGYNSIYIGRLVHPQNNFQDNIALGGSTYYAANGNCNLAGSGMIVLGHWNGVVSGVNSVIIGKDIGTTFATHVNSVIIGQLAGSYSDSTTAASGASLTNNVFIGSAAGQGSSGNYNVGIGSNALGGFIDGVIGSNNIELITSSSYRMDSIFGRNHDSKLNIQRTIAGDTSTNRIFIGAVASGDFAPSSILQVRAKNTTDKVLIAQGLASQSANIFEIQNSAGTAISLIDASGQISGVALNVASGITIPSGIPAVTTSKLYASGTTLYFNGSTIGGGGGTTTNALTFASGITFTSSTFNGSTAVTIGLPAATVYTSGSYANPTWITSIDSTTLSGAVPINKGGTALTSTPTNGQLLIGNGTNYTLSTLTAGSGMNVTNGAGSITINSSGITANTLTFASGLTSTTSTFNGSAAVTIGLPSTTVFGAGTSGWVPYYNSTSGIAISSGQSVYLGTVTSPFATAKTLIVKAAASQSVNIFEVQNSSGSGLFTIDQSGGVNFAPWSGTSTSPVKYDGANNRLVFTGSGTAASGINLNVLNDSTLSFESTAGQLFSISDGLASGTIFSVNDISGMPSIEVDASGLIKLGEYDGFIGIGTSQLYSQYSGKMEINTPSGYKGMIVRGSIGGTGNLFEAQNASSGTLWVVDASGRVNIGGVGSTNQLEVDTLSAATKGIVIKSFASQTANLFEVQNSSSTPILSISPSGAISGAITPTIITSTGGLTLTDIYNGYIIEQTGVVASGTFTIGTVTIPGWNCMIVNIGSGVIVSSGSNTMKSPGGLNKSRTQYSAISIYRRGSNDFVLTGDLA